MDRRTFLKSTGAAAAAGTAAAVPARAETPAALAVSRGARELTLATVWPLDTPVYGDSVVRLTRRIEAATEGRCRITPVAVCDNGLAAVTRGAADLYHGSEHFHLEAEPALAYFAALPGPFGFDAASCQAWLIAGGGQMLWDDLGADLGVKPLMAGHTGPSVGLWLKRPISENTAFAGLRLNVLGLAGRVLAALGGEPRALPPSELTVALAEGRLDGAEWAGPTASLAVGLHRSAKHVVPRAFTPAGSSYTLAIRRELWEALPSSDRAVFEACTAEEVRISLAEATAHRRIAWRAAAEQHGVTLDTRRLRQPPSFVEATAEAVAAVARSSSKARRIDASYRAFAAATRGTHRRIMADQVS